ncbi:substrate-binding domain-containing protein [Pusillimonas sp. TS35]|uniref:LacI family DNA-binding transcriptional regulator n=1 Tax=Paracandidimonas lactea TaxID=2895524 RepID=UPI00136C8ACC|nr:LacI family DNA-binding transcriptional regulator [Paracandidimonas lactea]MYN12465.1 substrate-binding domain-containing protein [Pusillimonas sp. TS35]
MRRKTPVSIIEIARQAGVSPATVSRAFNRPELVRDETLTAIRAVAHNSGFRPNRVGSSLRAGHTRTIGLLLPTLTNPVFAECFEGAEAHARAAGYSVMMSTSGYQPQTEASAVHELLDHRVEGLILTVGNPARNHMLRALRKQGMPYILVYNESRTLPFVSVNNSAAAAAMVSHLATLGHRRIGFISGPLAASDRARLRLQGARRQAKVLGLPEVRHWIAPKHTGAHMDSLYQLINGPEAPTVLFCSNDLLACSVISQLATLGLRVPKDISVCGFDGIKIGSLMTPPLTSVAQPSREFGARACAMLLTNLAGHRPPSIRLAHCIVEGGTVAAR